MKWIMDMAKIIGGMISMLFTLVVGTALLLTIIKWFIWAVSW